MWCAVQQCARKLEAKTGNYSLPNTSRETVYSASWEEVRGAVCRGAQLDKWRGLGILCLSINEENGSVPGG